MDKMLDLISATQDLEGAWLIASTPEAAYAVHWLPTVLRAFSIDDACRHLFLL